MMDVGVSFVVLWMLLGLVYLAFKNRHHVFDLFKDVVLDALPPYDSCMAAKYRACRRWIKGCGKRLKTSGHKKSAGLYASDFTEQPCRPIRRVNRITALSLLCSLLLCLSFGTAGVSGTALSRSTVLLSYALQHQAHLNDVAAVHPYVGSHQFFSTTLNYAGTVAAAVEQYSPEGVVHLQQQPEYERDAEGKWVWGRHPDMSTEQFEQLQQTVRERKHCFAYSLNELPGYTGDVPAFTISLKTDKPIYSRPRNYSALEQHIREEKFGEMYSAHMIEPAPHNTSYASCPHFPAKRDADGNWTDKRVTIDFRAVNRETVKDRYGLHKPEDLFQQVSKARYFTKIDLRSGFHQIRIKESDRPKTAFWWDNQLYQYTRLPMGLSNSPAAFQRIMDHEIADGGLQGFATCFIDDLLVYSDTPEEHIVHVAAVLDHLYKRGLRAHPEKSIFGCATMEYLGHNVSHQGVTPATAKILAIQELRVPKNVHELQSVLGFMNYYRAYVPNYSALQSPLNSLLKKGAKWEWTAEHQEAYDALKEALCKEGNALRRFESHLPTKLYTDWSKKGIGAVLSQVGEDGEEKMVACISRSLNNHERNYSSFEGELLACVWSVKTCRVYLHGIHFTIITDHQPLLWLMTNTELTGKHARWYLLLQDYDFTVEHRAGLKHNNADIPSRFPRESSVDTTGAHMDEDPPSAEPPFTSCLATMGGGYDQTEIATVLLSEYRLQLLDGLDAVGAGEGFIDDFAPTADQILEGHGYKLSVHFDPEPVSSSPQAVEEQQQLQARATGWVKSANTELQQITPNPPQQLTHTPFTDAQGVHPTLSLNTECVTAEFFNAAKSEGVVLLELFGGLCAGLEMCLANQIIVKRYIYCDTDPAASTLSLKRVSELQAKYPNLLAPGMERSAHIQLPQDVKQISSEALVKAGATDGDQWLVVAGWECQDLSPAGTGRGLDGPRSSTFFDMLSTVGTLQQLQRDRPPAYILENTAMQYNWNSKRIREQDFPRVTAAVGEPICFDAAQFDAFCHRVRNYWTNLTCPD
jgi:hypothetical protein